MFGLLLIVTFGLPHGHSDIVPWSIGREYDQSSYVPVRSPFAQFNMNSKLKVPRSMRPSEFYLQYRGGHTKLAHVSVCSVR